MFVSPASPQAQTPGDVWVACVPSHCVLCPRGGSGSSPGLELGMNPENKDTFVPPRKAPGG